MNKKSNELLPFPWIVCFPRNGGNEPRVESFRTEQEALDRHHACAKTYLYRYIPTENYSYEVTVTKYGKRPVPEGSS